MAPDPELISDCRILSRFFVVPPVFQTMPGSIVTPVIWMNPILKKQKMP